jgi:hypothetical protein
MKNIILSVMLFILALSNSFAQETVFNSSNSPPIHLSPLVEISQIDDLAGISIGAGTAIFWGDFYTGLYFLNHSNKNPSPGNYDLHFQHGGLWAGYLLNPHQLLHFQAGLKMGYGSITKDYIIVSNNIDRYSSNIFIANPTIGAALNLTKFMKLGVNAGYRFTTGISVFETENFIDIKDYRGMTFEVTLGIGNF